MRYQKTTLAIFVGAVLTPWTYAQTEALDEVVVTEQNQKLSGSATGDYLKISDQKIDGKKFKDRSATLGNALAGELSIHTNPFGGGASAPIIRGQEGFRVKMLQNGSDIIDMSSISPDHAVAADSLLASQIEVVRGGSTLLYSTASPAGVLNIVDKRIPTEVPQNGLAGEFNLRGDTASRERAATVGVSLGLGKNVVVRAEGLARKSDNYRVPAINLGETLKYVPDTHHRSNVGTLGISYVGERGYIGVSYNQRRDKYGLPGHNHGFDKCSSHIANTTNGNKGRAATVRYYLPAYPHLMQDDDLIGYPHLDGCGVDHSHAGDVSHSNPFGYEHDHSRQGPWIDLYSKRWDFRGELQNPLPFLAKARFNVVKVDYHHNERDHNTDDAKEKAKNTTAVIGDVRFFEKPEALFQNRSLNARAEFDHKEFAGLSGTYGVQYSQQKTSATIAKERQIHSRNPLVPHTNKQLAFFGKEQLRWKDFLFEVAARHEQQVIPVQYNYDVLAKEKIAHSAQSSQLQDPDLTTYKQKAFSYSGGMEWYLDEAHRVAFQYSHNERLPAAMELYYQGKHLATSSFMHGNQNLRKEVSDNFEIGIARETGVFDYKLSIYQNHFDNYIHAENLKRDGNLYIRRFTQSKAKLRGIEGEISYSPVPEHKFTLFGDFISGKVYGLPAIYGDKIYGPYYTCEQKDSDGSVYLDDECLDVVGYETIHKPERYPARLPPARLGLRINSQFGDHWKAYAEYTKVFEQRRTAVAVNAQAYEADEYTDSKTGHLRRPLRTVLVNESATKGYNLVNLGITYSNKIKEMDYEVSLTGHNLLNEPVYIHTSFLSFVPQVGRNIVLGFGLKF